MIILGITPNFNIKRSEITFESINKYTGAHIPKRQIQEIVMRSARDFDAFYKMRQGDVFAGNKSGSIMAMSVDGKGAVICMQDLREQTRKAAMSRSATLRNFGSPYSPPLRRHTT